MKNRIFIGMIFTLLSVSFIHCNRVIPFSIEREIYNGEELRMDGYYYTKDNTFGHEGFFVDVCFLNRNGIYLYGEMTGSAESLAAKEIAYANGSYYNMAKNRRPYWGVFRIDGNHICIERWVSSFGGPCPVIRIAGIILDNETFAIIRYNDEAYLQTPETYHFKCFPEKPDSVCKFIN